MFGGASHLKARSNVIFGIGSSPLKGQAGPFVEYLVAQLKARGYRNIFYVKEGYTSQKCPHCGHQVVGVKDTHRRVKCCNTCDPKVYHHRDIMAGHNIANILEGYVIEGKRPNYLVNPDQKSD